MEDRPAVTSGSTDRSKGANNRARFAYLLIGSSAILLLLTSFVRACTQLLTIENVSMVVPVANQSISGFLEHSILYQPRDVVRDGLPWFGTARDDWKAGARKRKHMGLDYYSDTITVLAAAAGEVTAVGRGKQWGGSITIRHANKVETMYLHISQWKTFVGANVKAGEIIATITTPEGNAIQPQLHFSIKVDEHFRDPLPYILERYRTDKTVLEQLNRFQSTKSARVSERDSLLKLFLDRR